MKSFKNYIVESDNPLSLGRILNVHVGEETLLCLVVRSETPDGAILLILSPDNPNVGNLINSKSLENAQFDVIKKNILPQTNYFFQNQNPTPIKRIEYHDKPKIKENIDEDITKTALLYFQSKYRSLKNKDATNEKLNLILELLFSEFDDSRIRFIP